MNLDLADLLSGLDISSISGLSSQDAAVLAITSTVSSLISLAISILLIVAMWKLFTKAGDKGWKAIIPFYNQYTLFKLVWKRSLFWVTLIISIIIVVLACILSWDAIVYMSGGAAGVSEDQFMMVILGLTLAILVLSLPLFIINIILCFKIAKAYGKGAGWGFGLLFFYPIFLCILAFGSAQYVLRKVSAGEPAPVPVSYNPVSGGYVPQQPVYGQPQAYVPQPAQTYVPTTSQTTGTYTPSSTQGTFPPTQQ